MFMLMHLVDCCVVVFEQTELHMSEQLQMEQTLPPPRAIIV